MNTSYITHKSPRLSILERKARLAEKTCGSMGLLFPQMRLEKWD